jgi:hypothetical protein
MRQGLLELGEDESISPTYFAVILHTELGAINVDGLRHGDLVTMEAAGYDNNIEHIVKHL